MPEAGLNIKPLPHRLELYHAWAAAADGAPDEYEMVATAQFGARPRWCV